MVSGSGEPNLSFHACRFIVYISTFAKPMELYLTLVFSIERIFTRILSNYIMPTKKHRLFYKRLYFLSILIGVILILSMRLYDVLKLIKYTERIYDSDDDSLSDTTDINNSSDDDTPSYQYCFRLMSAETYAKFLSFYLIQYWLDYVMLTLIILILLCIIIHQYFLPRLQRRSLSSLSVNTKLYICLSSCVIVFESILLYLHHFVSNSDDDNRDTQTLSLRTILFVYNFRCIIFPLIICLTTCDSLKQWFYQFIILRPYLDNIDENDQTKTMIDSS